MTTCKAVTSSFGPDGEVVDGGSLFLPVYLDWMPIKAKAFWFLSRGLGDPRATHVLLDSQGERLLCKVETPLQHLKLDQLKEIDHGLEERIDRYCRENGISRVPRNQ